MNFLEAVPYFYTKTTGLSWGNVSPSYTIKLGSTPDEQFDGFSIGGVGGLALGACFLTLVKIANLQAGAVEEIYQIKIERAQVNPTKVLAISMIGGAIIGGALDSLLK